jgi:hypothetical protein
MALYLGNVPLQIETLECEFTGLMTQILFPICQPHFYWIFLHSWDRFRVSQNDIDKW